jgi:hypothetical protein
MSLITGEMRMPQPTVSRDYKKQPMLSMFNLRQFIINVFFVSIWINVSEIFRYFVIVMPEMRSFLGMVPGILPMNLPIFAVWFGWDNVLTAAVVFMFWLVAQVFGNTLRSVFLSGTVAWAFFFLLCWVGMCNMGLAPPLLLLKVLPLAWLEVVIASLIASRLYQDDAPLNSTHQIL